MARGAELIWSGWNSELLATASQRRRFRRRIKPASTMPRRKPQKSRRSPRYVYLNIPYDTAFEDLYLAYVAGLSTLGLEPRALMEIDDEGRRLEQVVTLIQSCDESLHDLSRVQLDTKPPTTPRFNMPFELGVAVAFEKFQGHRWHVFEEVPDRMKKSLSDLNGTRAHIHGGDVRRVLAALRKVFARNGDEPTAAQMHQQYLALKQLLPKIMKQTGERSPYCGPVFRRLKTAAQKTTNADKRGSI